MSAELYFAAKLNELSINVPLGVSLADDRGDVVLVRTGPNEVAALIDCCSHADIPLSSGTCANGSIECPAHGAKFSLETGAVQRGPALVGVKKLIVEIRGDEVWVEEP